MHTASVLQGFLNDGTPPLRYRLSTRIIATSLVALGVVLAMVCWTLWLSWQLEGAGAAINDTGSLRMRANRIAVTLQQGAPDATQRVNDDLVGQAQIMLRLVRGNPARPLFLPNSDEVRNQMNVVSRNWHEGLVPAARRAIAEGQPAIYLASLTGFVDEADRLVRMIEQDNAEKTSMLRFSQGVLLVIACMGTLAVICLLYLWIILPVLRLRDGLRRMAARELNVRLPVTTRDEFGALAVGFNRMADELAGMTGELERRVEEKTAQLASQNRDLSALYEMTAFLNEQQDVEHTCRGFLRRVMEQFDADGGSIRTLDPRADKLHIVVSEGLSHVLEETEHCMSVNACLCGEAAREGVIVIRDFNALGDPNQFQCAKDGFSSLAVFRIGSTTAALGSFSLHFREPRRILAAERQLLDTLGQHLGVALENRRLAVQAQQLAVSHERSLVAQGLHDSIAQGLNFLNLQVQLLDDAAQRGDIDDVREIAPLMATGVTESYQDVRELLTNFRTKLGQGELFAGVDEILARFRRQTGMQVELALDADDGAPLSPEHQLQVLFILQEALSNVRKHAQASKVQIRICNRRDFDMTITDDGVGYDPKEVDERAEGHIGLHIMAERAARIHATIALRSQPGAGASVSLHLPQAERQAA